MIIVALEDNEYQAIQVQEKMDELNLVRSNARVLYPTSKQDVQFLQYGSFLEGNLVIIHTKNYDVIKEIFKGDLDYWDIILYVEKLSKVAPLLATLDTDNIHQMSMVRDWDDKINFFKTRLKNYKFERGVKDLVMRLLVRKPSEYASVYTYFNSLDEDHKINIDDVQYVIGDSDIYRLDDCLFNIIFGIGKRKTSWMIDYFVNVRGYHPVWMYQQVIKYAHQVVMLYTLKHKGVIKHPLNKSDYKKRMEVVQLTPDDNFLGYYQQKRVFEQMKEHSKESIMLRIRQLYRNRVQEEGDLYKLLVEGELWQNK